MKKYILISLILVFFISTIFAQSNIDDGYLYMKCGTKFGKKSEMVDACVGEFKKENREEFKKQHILCSCIMETIAKHYTYEEFESLFIKYGDDWPKAMLRGSNSVVITDLQECVLNSVDEDYDWTDREESFKEGSMIGCIREFESNPNLKDLDIDILAYCNCVTEEFLKRGFAISDLDEIRDKNSVLYNEVFISCIGESGVINETYNSTNDITGSIKYASVPLINFGGVFKVKIRIGNFSKYFTIDSGASDVMISSSFERDLILEGLVKRDDYLVRRRMKLD